MRVERISNGLTAKMAALLAQSHRTHSPFGATHALADDASAARAVAAALDINRARVCVEGTPGGSCAERRTARASRRPRATEQVATVDHSDVMNRAYERLNAGDVDGFGELVADDFVEHEELPVPASGKEGVVALFRMMRRAFPDMTMSVEDCIVSGDKAVARVRCTGTHQGEFMGISASGQRTDMQLIDIMRIEDGLIREHWGVTDMLALMQQIGAVPTPG